MSDPLIIAIDGLPGTGKTTLATELARLLRANYYKEPYSGIGFIGTRELLHDPGHSPRTRALLMMAARSAKDDTIFRGPYNSEGIMVFDRYIMSTVGHQSESRGDALVYYSIHKAMDFPLPDLQVHLTADIEILRKRVEGRLDNDELDEHNLQSEEAHFQYGLSHMRGDGVTTLELDTGTTPEDECLRVIQEVIESIKACKEESHE